MISRLRSPLATLAFIVAMALAFLPDPARAVDLPSSLTGTYQALPDSSLAGWACELRAYEIRAALGDSNRVLSADCQTPTGRYGGAVSTANYCPSTEITQPPMVRFGDACGPAPFYCVPPGLPRLSVQSYVPATAQCALGQVTVQVGAMAPAVMCRTQIIVPTFTYAGCAAPEPPKSPHYARLCRQFGMYCGR